MRTIIVNGKNWKWKVGRIYANIWSPPPERKRFNVDLSTLTGWSFDDIENGRADRYFSVTPKHIANWILNEKT